MAKYGPPKGTGGAPQKITPEKAKLIKDLMRLKPSLNDVAYFVEVNPLTIERWIRDNHDMTFVEFRDKNLTPTRHMVMRNLIEAAGKKNMTALIYLSKILCGHSEKQNIEVDHKSSDRSMSPTPKIDISKLSDQELETLKNVLIRQG